MNHLEQTESVELKLIEIYLHSTFQCTDFFFPMLQSGSILLISEMSLSK